MAQRSFSVLVVPARWGGTSDELADRLSSVARQPSDRLAGALGRGPVTLDADLHREEAERLLTQLERLEIPAEIRDEADDEVVASSAGGSGDRTDEASDDAPGEGEGGDASGGGEEEWGEFAELQESLADVVESAGVEPEPVEEFAELESVEGGAEGASGESGGDGADGWGEILGEEAGGGEARSESDERAGESPDDSQTIEEVPGGAGEIEIEPSESAATNAPAGPAEVADDSGRGLQAIEEPDEPETPALEELSADGSEAGEASGGDAGPGSSSGSLEPSGTSRPREDESPPQIPTPEADGPGSPGGPADGGSFEPADDSSDFDGARMSDVLTDSVGGESVLSDGSFDDRPEHIPALAALLNLVAPGAGEIYNGRPQKAWACVFRAILIVPWVRSVRGALERGEAIREGEVSRPPEGSFVESLKYVGTLYAGLAAMALGGYLAWKIAASQWEADPSVDAEMPAVDRQNAFQEASLVVHGARIDAWQRAGRQRVEDEERFTMSDEERAARLFAIGYRHCRADDYEMCESAMRKASRLSSPYRKRAYRLQSWASVQQDPARPDKPMPEVEISRGLLASGPDVGVDVGGAGGGPESGDSESDGPGEGRDAGSAPPEDEEPRR